MKGRAILLLSLLLLSAAPPSARAEDQWVWLSGSNSGSQPGSYGTKGVPGGANVPGARYRASAFGGADGTLWLFGGAGMNATTNGMLNDLWKWDGTYWTWISGSDKVDTVGVYGTMGTPSATNRPGGRDWGASWTAADGSFWLFGGDGYAASGASWALNDLWKWDGTNWTWISGSNATGAYGTYGTKGVAASGNVPGSRYGAVSWVGDDGSLWLFGGYGRAASTDGYLNDLWKFDGTYWTWVSGSDAADAYGNYGTKGVASAVNVPGARGAGVGWRDGDGNLWFHGGYGYTASNFGELNDLWKWDGTYWTWVSGGSGIEAVGVYGTQGVADPSNVPGCHMGHLSWLDSEGKFWIFGGWGNGSSAGTGLLNDLWKYDGTNWTWMAGSTTIEPGGVYGTKGVPASGNCPGGRYYAVAWYDSANAGLRLFGGYGRYAPLYADLLNDLWGRTLSDLVPPDLSVPSLTVASNVAAGCESFDVEFEVLNGGGAAGACRAGVYLSADATITVADELLGTTSVPALTGAQRCTLEVAVTLPGLTGDSVHVGVIADDQDALTESNESNNARAAAVANLTPRVISILDVKNDQGRSVRIRFAHSSRDVAGSATPVTQYEAFRRIDGDALRAARMRLASALLEGWEYAGAVPAHGEAEYSMVVPTLKDSTSAGPGYSVFFVRAATAAPTTFFDSCRDSGYSVDNLPPYTPAPFAGVPTLEGNVLHWGANTESDLACYRLYRGTDPGFTPGPGNLLEQSTDTTYTDERGTYVYKLTAVDVNGNESACATVQVTNLLGVPEVAWGLSLGPARPNPASGSRLVIPFSLPAGGTARLELVDVSGRRVAARDVGALGAGPHTVNLAEGRRLPAGLYLVRLVSGAQTRVQRVVVLE